MTLSEETGRNREHKLQPVATTPGFYSTNYATMIESGNKPILSVSELQDLGFKIVIFPSTLLFTAANSMLEVLIHLKSKGTTEHLLNRLLTLEEFNRLTGLSRFRQLEDKYLPEVE